MKLQKLMTSLLLVCAFMCVAATGCNKTTLAPDGIYQGDKTLYQAENAINTAHENFVEFYRWEKQYRDILPVEVSRAADYMRQNEQQWIGTANALHDAYEKTPTAENKDKLALSVNLLQTALHEAAAYMVAAKKAAPNDGLKNVQLTTGK
jgi:hypothetical protein